MTRLTDGELADVHGRVNDGRCHLCRNGEHRRGCPACDGTGAFSLGADAMMSIVAELRERRAADLTAGDVEALEWVRHQCKRAEHGHPTYKTKTALAVLDKLLAAAEGK